MSSSAKSLASWAPSSSMGLPSPNVNALDGALRLSSQPVNAAINWLKNEVRPSSKVRIAGSAGVDTPQATVVLPFPGVLELRQSGFGFFPGFNTEGAAPNCDPCPTRGLPRMAWCGCTSILFPHKRWQTRVVFRPTDQRMSDRQMEVAPPLRRLGDEEEFPG